MQMAQPSPRPSPFLGRERELTSHPIAGSIGGAGVALNSSPSPRSEQGEGRGEESPNQIFAAKRKSVLISARSRLRIGVDTGGTFTDFVKLSPEGLVFHKVRSTPDDPSRAIMEGVSALGGKELTEIVHGSTVATNAVLERKGAVVGMLTTAGFEDVLAIGRQSRSELYNIFVPAPRPIVGRDLIFGVAERLDASGKILARLNMTEVDRCAADLKERKVEMVIVCFLHSHANPRHERRVAARLRALGFRVCASHEVLPEYREFERWSTTAVNAYVTPLMDRYLGKLQERLEGSPLRIMQSNGGTIGAEAARAQAVRTVLSGPAGGVVGAQAVARMAGFDRIISFDMGGTSTDVSLINGDIGMTKESRIGDFPVRLPMIDIHTVGAGGGSIAFIDSGGALCVGPRSAGAVPGPACYGAGKEMTVTDANLVLGRLDPAGFLGGRMPLDSQRAAEAAELLGASLKVSVPKLAEGITRVANANMERAIRRVSLERGFDPREFALVAFGGAGGMHACEIADNLGIRTVIVPRYAGVLSALGMLFADVTKDYSASVLRREDAITAADLARLYQSLEARARHDLASEGFGPNRQNFERVADIRYVGQSYELSVPYSAGVRATFDRRHEQLYGYANPARPAEIVNVRVRASGVTDKPPLPYTRPRRHAAKSSMKRSARFGGRQQMTVFHRWADLAPGAFGIGPAVVTGAEATAVIPPGFSFRVDGFGNLIVVPGQ